MHLSSITASEKRYPETVLYDNQPKCRVDVADQMNRLYSVKTGARRWPVSIFNNILGLACISVDVLYTEHTNEKVKRRSFIFKLVAELRK